MQNSPVSPIPLFSPQSTRPAPNTSSDRSKDESEFFDLFERRSNGSALASSGDALASGAAKCNGKDTAAAVTPDSGKEEDIPQQDDFGLVADQSGKLQPLSGKQMGASAEGDFLQRQIGDAHHQPIQSAVSPDEPILVLGQAAASIPDAKQGLSNGPVSDDFPGNQKNGLPGTFHLNTPQAGQETVAQTAEQGQSVAALPGDIHRRLRRQLAPDSSGDRVAEKNMRMGSVSLAEMQQSGLQHVASSSADTALEQTLLATQLSEGKPSRLAARDENASLPGAKPAQARSSNGAPQAHLNPEVAVKAFTASGAFLSRDGGAVSFAEMSNVDGRIDLQGDVRLQSVLALRADNLFHRPEIPRAIAVQLADAVQRIRDARVEVSLNPAELGRVRMNLTTNENGLMVAITAERGETLDLMRRNIAVLAQEFRDAGHVSVSFSFGQRSDSDERQLQDDKRPSSASVPPQDGEIPTIEITLAPKTGLDIRL